MLPPEKKSFENSCCQAWNFVAISSGQLLISGSLRQLHLWSKASTKSWTKGFWKIKFSSKEAKHPKTFLKHDKNRADYLRSKNSKSAIDFNTLRSKQAVMPSTETLGILQPFQSWTGFILLPQTPSLFCEADMLWN